MNCHRCGDKTMNGWGPMYDLCHSCYIKIKEKVNKYGNPESSRTRNDLGKQSRKMVGQTKEAKT